MITHRTANRLSRVHPGYTVRVAEERGHRWYSIGIPGAGSHQVMGFTEAAHVEAWLRQAAGTDPCPPRVTPNARLAVDRPDSCPADCECRDGD